MRQQHVDAIVLGSIEQAAQIVLSAGLFACVGIADTRQHLPLGILAPGIDQPHGRAGADDIGTADIGPDRSIGERGGIVRRVDILNQCPRHDMLAQSVENLDPQRSELDRVHSRGSFQPADQGSAQENMPPARYHLTIGPGEDSPNQGSRLAGERTGCQPSLACCDDTDPFGRTAGRVGYVELGFQAKQFVELVGRHCLQLFDCRQVRQVQIRARRSRLCRQGLNDLARLRRARPGRFGGGRRAGFRSLRSPRRRRRCRCGAGRRLVKSRGQQVDRSILGKTHGRSEDEGRRAQEPRGLHRPIPGTSIASSIGCSGSSPPWIRAATNSTKNTIAKIAPIRLPLIAKFFASRSKC